MGEAALPCIVCGKQLENVEPDFTSNQPYEGLAYFSYGAYGGTEFDPMDGSHLEINVCDECLVKAAEQNRVYVGRWHVHYYCERMYVGRQRVESPLVPWRKGMPDDEREINIEPDEVGVAKEIEWKPEAVEYFKRQLEGGEQE